MTNPYVAAYRLRHKLAGLCIECPRPIVLNLTHCQKHRWKKPLLCRHCREEMSEGLRTLNKRIHPECKRVTRRVWRNRKVTLGYLMAHRRAALRYQGRHRENGLCVQCPQKAVPGLVSCERHRGRHGKLQTGFQGEFQFAQQTL